MKYGREEPKDFTVIARSDLEAVREGVYFRRGVDEITGIFLPDAWRGSELANGAGQVFCQYGLYHDNLNCLKYDEKLGRYFLSLPHGDGIEDLLKRSGITVHADRETALQVTQRVQR